MLRTSLTTLAAALLLSAASAAQQPTPAASPAQGGDNPKPKSAGEQPASREGQPVNVKLELTITDQIGPGEPGKKTVSLIVADRSAGSIRSIGNSVRAILNVDATPQILPNGSIKVQLGLEYNPRQGNGTVDKIKAANGDVIEVPREPGGSGLNQRVAIVLEPGKPLILSQAADPISDRKITVEVRASILK